MEMIMSVDLLMDAVREPAPDGTDEFDDPGAPLDLVRSYLDEVGRTPLLTAADEVELAKRIEVGLYAAELLRCADVGAGTSVSAPVWDRDGEPAAGPPTGAVRATRAELLALARDGERAKDHMLRANLRLVVSVAKKYAGRELPLLDIIQEGNLGLIRAVEKFDYVKGFKFSTYAMWWIRQAIQRGFAEQGRSVRLPVHVTEDLAKLDRANRQLLGELGRAPQPEELAERTEFALEKVQQLQRVSRPPVSLDGTVGEDNETRVIDLIEDTSAASPEDVAEQRALTARLEKLVETLAPREAKIISLRFGLADGRPRTLEEIAQQLRLTRERIRQLERQSLAELRDPNRCADLVGWAS
jgi:RNA polymerase primary sigma factor